MKNSPQRGCLAIGVLALALVTVSCTSGRVPATSTTVPSKPSTTITSTTLPSVSISTTKSSVAPLTPTPHRIAVRTVDGVAEFYDTLTGDRFVPRGNNYNILRQVDDAIMGQMALDTTLSTGLYDVDQVEADLSRMEEMGYNIVRIMPETCGATGCITGLTGGVRGEYMDNMVDFMRRAKAHGIFTWIASNTLPDAGTYINEAHRADNDTFAGSNSEYLTPAGLSAYNRYFTDLVDALIERDAPLDYLFSYSLRQEHSFDSTAPPLSLDAGEVTTANGETYEMGDAEDKARMVDEGLLFWITQTGDAIRRLDPSALISVGFFAPNRPNRFRGDDDNRLVRAVAALDSDLDFVDFHVYPTPPHALLVQHVENFQMAERDDIPIVMGELAAFTWYTSEEAAAKALHDLEVESCTAGFDGWVTWSWDISIAQPDIWHAMTGEGLVGEVLSPSARPDPCAPGLFEFFEYSLTATATATASRALPDEPPEAAIDGGSPQWGSGGDAPQYLEILLASPSSVDEIRLTVAQYPEGPTRHEIWVLDADGPLHVVHTFEGSTAEGDILSFIPDAPLEKVQLVRIVTVRSPSWVAWREVDIVSHDPSSG